MTKVIIQHGKYRGLYEIILLQCRSFFIVKWWKAISITQHLEEEAILKLCDLLKKYNLKQCDIYDWSGDEFFKHKIKEPTEMQLDADA